MKQKISGRGGLAIFAGCFGWFLMGCSSLSTPGEHAARELLALAVEAKQAMEYAPFNQSIAQAQQAGAQWVFDPLMVVHRFAGPGIARKFVVTIRQSKDSAGKLEVLVINDGFADDSVRGERTAVTLENGAGEAWFITQATRIWRCWPDRGHSHYSTEPCR